MNLEPIYQSYSQYCQKLSIEPVDFNTWRRKKDSFAVEQLKESAVSFIEDRSFHWNLFSRYSFEDLQYPPSPEGVSRLFQSYLNFNRGFKYCVYVIEGTERRVHLHACIRAKGLLRNSWQHGSFDQRRYIVGLETGRYMLKESTDFQLYGDFSETGRTYKEC